ncbi:MAG: magnesium transporter CorA family protein [Actinomycetota bacterium]|nr:magnesium transporter CorA family protein [Actinomycetota bacterium]
MAEWIDLVDPDEAAVREAAPTDLHPDVVEHLAHRPSTEDELPRPRLETHGDYVWGVFLAAKVDRERDRVFYQEVDVVLTEDRVVTVRKTPPSGEEPFDPAHLREACARGEPLAGMILYHLVDEVGDRYLELVDDLNAEIDELEDDIDRAPTVEIRRRLSDLRHDMLTIRRSLGPTRDAVRAVADDRIELEGGHLFSRDKPRLFPPEVDLRFFSAYDKIMRAYEGLELSRDLAAGARDYLQAKIANDQSEVTKQLAAIGSILLVPTFIVGVYGQNFDHMPELHWYLGYVWSWGIIVLSTVGQVIFFKKRGWL